MKKSLIQLVSTHVLADSGLLENQISGLVPNMMRVSFFSVQTLMADHQMCKIINATILQQFFFKSVKIVVIHFFKKLIG